MKDLNSSSLKVSVIIPVYNAEGMVRQCVKSVTNQVYKNVEIILINDGSTDNSLQICREIAKTNSGVKVVSQTNRGLPAARNAGIKKANGDYILFLDADDTLSNDSIKTLAKIAQQHQYDVIRYNYHSYNNGKATTGTLRGLGNKTFHKTDLPRLVEYFFGAEQNIPCYSWSFIIKKNLVPRYNERLKRYEDIEFLSRLLFNINTMYFLDKPLYNYNYNSQGITKDPQKVIDNIAYAQQAYVTVKKTLSEHGMLSEPLSRQINTSLFYLTIDKLKLYANYGIHKTAIALKKIFQNPIYRKLDTRSLTPKVRVFYRLISMKWYNIAAMFTYLFRVREGN